MTWTSVRGTARPFPAVSPLALIAAIGNVSGTATITVRSLAFERLALNGGRHACAQLANGTAYCWGDHGEHALGH